jgi:hypothetical protein
LSTEITPTTAQPCWLTVDVVSIAQGIDADRTFERLPILANALEDAGCDDSDVLTHCYDPNAHDFRGCWVVDQLLQKE